MNDSRAVVEGYIRHLIAHDPSASTFIADDARWWVAGHWDGGGDFSKDEVQEIGALSTCWFAGPMRFAMDSIIAEGSRVAVELRSEAILRDGSDYRNNYVMIYEVVGGLITSVREYLDTKIISDALDRIGVQHPARAIRQRKP